MHGRGPGGDKASEGLEGNASAEPEENASAGLETERLSLRAFEAGDRDLIEALFRLHNDPDVMRFIDGGAPKTPAEIEREYHDRFVAYGYLAARERATGRFVGWFGLHRPRDENRRAVPGEYGLGYRLHKEFWGRGYATEGSRALIDDAFERRGVLRVRADTMAVNRRSRRVMEKAGLRYVRTYHEEWDDPLPGTEHGEVEYALLREDWQREGRPRTASGVVNSRPEPRPE